MVEITEDEAVLYDRQIRLWGVDAQRALRAAHVFVKRCGALGAEVCKNLVLSGVSSLTVLDVRVVEEGDAANNFLVRTETGKSFGETCVPNLQILNPLVNVKYVTDELNEDSIGNYSVVCITDGSKLEYSRVNALCRAHDVTFLACNTWGVAGFMFMDSGEQYEYVAEKTVVKKGKSEGQEAKRRKVDDASDDTQYETRVARFTEFARAELPGKLRHSSPAVLITQGLLDEVGDLENYCEEMCKDTGCKEVTKDLLRNLSGCLVPVCAVIGGIVSQEIIKIVSKKDDPIVNSFYYEGLSGAGIVENMTS